MASSRSFYNVELDQVWEEENSGVRTLILNRPQKLNSLTFHMASQLLKNLKAYAEESSVKLVILKGNGKAFCAGGDIVSLVNVSTIGHWSFGQTYYGKLINLVYVVATYKKPLVSILNGIVMGCGAGISILGRFRVVTENSVFSMPESVLGLIPDVGASHFLSRLPGFFGEYLGLTGARLDGEEMLACGLATHFVFSKNLPSLEKALYGMDSMEQAVVSEVIDGFADRVSLRQESAYRRLRIINKCFSEKTVEEIISALELEALNGADEKWLSATIKSIKSASPTSLKLFLKSIREGRTQDISRCLIREYRIVSHLLRGMINRDFFEGCRAILLDKDKQPKWEPSKLELVSNERVDWYFAKVDDEDWEDLELASRSNPIGIGRAKL